MFPILAADFNVTWHLIPLTVVISLVYSASRYEDRDRILRRAARLFLTILGFMAAIFVVLLLLSFRL